MSTPPTRPSPGAPSPEQPANEPELEVSLEAIRTDGWFERIGESVGSFQALCDILGERFFAFSLITGARITALSVDRQNPDDSLVDFEVGGNIEEGAGAETRQLTLDRFRQRLVAALVAHESPTAAPERETDTEAIQLHIGVRYLLLAPLFGYGLLWLKCLPGKAIRTSRILVSKDGVEQELSVEDLRQLLRSHVLQELEEVSNRRQASGGGIELDKIPEAQAAAEKGEHHRVLDLLGPWAAPLSILLRTPEGQSLGPETKGQLSDALGLLGEAVAALGDAEQAEEILRLAVQYGVDNTGAGAAYARLGARLVKAGRNGEAIALLRRAANTGAAASAVWPQLALAFLNQRRFLAAYAATIEGREAGLASPELDDVQSVVLKHVPRLADWQELVESGAA